MACCASSRPLLDGFFSRSAASFASRSLRKRSVFWARSSRSSSCSFFNERFVGALGFSSIVASLVSGFGRCARFIGALGFFSFASCSRFVGWGASSDAAFDCSLAATSFFLVHGTMGAKSELEMGVLLDEPSPPVNFAASCAGILVCDSASAYRWIWFHPTRLCEVSAQSGRLHRRASLNGTAFILFARLADDHC